MKDIRQELQAVEDRLRGLREDRARAARVAESAKAAVAESDDQDGTPVFETARAAVEAVKEIEAKVDQSQEQQIGLLRQLGDLEAGKSGWSLPGVNGWATAARQLDLARGELRVDLPGASLLAQTLGSVRPASVEPAPPGVNAGLNAPAPSNRWLYPVLPQEPFPAIGELTATDYVISTISPEVTGVEIPPDSGQDKAVLPVNVALATPTASTYSIVAENVPARLFDSKPALQQFLGRECSRALSAAVDAAVVDAVESAAPPSGSTGADLVAKVRNALADTHDLGGQPSVIALTPSDAASLDLSVDPAGRYLFRVDAAGSGSPVWTLAVREVPTISAPTLVDPATLGLIYVGDGTILVDVFSKMEKNLTRVRVEVELVPHVRNVTQGAYVIS